MNFEKGINSIYNTDIERLFLQNKTYTEIAKLLSDDPNEHEKLRKYAGQYIRHIMNLDEDVISHNEKLAKSDQRSKDLLRIQRKTTRNDFRNLNALEEYNKQLINILSDTPIKIKKAGKFVTGDKDGTLVLQLSDLHLNTVVNIPGVNNYDFTIAAKRLEKLCDHIIATGKEKNINKLFICLGGDLLTSSRRLDELLNLATNNAIASVMATQLIGSFIHTLADKFTIKIGSVTGNESRLDKNLGFTNLVATNNWDTTIYMTLELLFKNHDRVDFVGFASNELVFRVEEKNFLLIHGHTVPNKICQKDIQNIVGKYSQQGVKIDYTLLGHIHSTYISDNFSRNSSLIGSDEYAAEALNYSSRASQNLHIVRNGDIMSMNIDLQDYDGYIGFDLSNFDKYPMTRSLNQENEKSRVNVIQTF